MRAYTHTERDKPQNETTNLIINSLTRTSVSFKKETRWSFFEREKKSNEQRNWETWCNFYSAVTLCGIHLTHNVRLLFIASFHGRHISNGSMFKLICQHAVCGDVHFFGIFPVHVFLSVNTVKVQTLVLFVQDKASCCYLRINVHFSLGFRGKNFEKGEKKNDEERFVKCQRISAKKKKIRMPLVRKYIKIYLQMIIGAVYCPDKHWIHSMTVNYWPLSVSNGKERLKKNENEQNMAIDRLEKWKELSLFVLTMFKFKWMCIWNISQYKFVK